MPDQIYIGNFPGGEVTSRTAFVIDNNVFPFLFNMYVWRGRVKRKRGTILLGQMQIQTSVSSTLSGGSINLLTGLGSPSSLSPGTLSLGVGGNVYTEPSPPNGTLVGAPAGTGTVNYVTGVVTIAGGGGSAIIGTYSYFPGRVSTGQRDFVNAVESIYPVMMSFDIQNSYQVNQTGTPFFYNVNFYKGTQVPFVWSGADYQQFWTTNYSGALWATNGVPGFNFLNGTYTSGSGTTAITFNFQRASANFTTLVLGDKLWFNEWTAGGVTLNGIVGVVTSVAGAAAGNYVVSFTSSQTVSGTGIVQMLTNTIPGQDGIKWYDGDPTAGTGYPAGTGLGWVNFAPPLTNATVTVETSTPALYYLIGALLIVPFKDRLLFFNPTIGTSGGTIVQLQDVVIWSWNGTPFYTVYNTANLSASTGVFTSLVPANQSASYFNSIPKAAGPYFVDQTGLGGFLSAGISEPIITVANNEDVLLVGFGGGRGRKTRLVYSGNDIFPFLFYSINSELPSTSTFSSITLDKGAIDIGVYGITLTDQQSSTRIDLDIPDSVFQISNLSNGFQRVNAVRDFQKEWIYFSYPANYAFQDPGTNAPWKYPTQTFLFNYRDNTWAVLYENYTSHGTYRASTGFTWATLPYQNWGQWVDPWNAGIQSAQFPNIVGGTPQGFVQIIGEGVGESPSCNIIAISSANGGTATQILSFNHCLASNNPNTETGDFIYITSAIGLLTSTITSISQATQAVITTVNTFNVGSFVTINGVVGMTQLNGNTYQVVAQTAGSITLNVNSTNFAAYISGGTVTSAFNGLIGQVIRVVDINNFIVDIPFPQGTYLGLGVFAKLAQPYMQTKQFNPYWDQGRQVRLAVQKYLMDTTFDAQVTVNIFLSQDDTTPWNAGPFVPSPNRFNSSLIYTQIMYTCPESTNLGLTPANSNLQMPTAETQDQIWHRFNTSLIGDSVQVGITLSISQMKNLDYATSEITLHGMHLVVDKGPQLA